jgi:hypothetical protein
MVYEEYVRLSALVSTKVKLEAAFHNLQTILPMADKGFGLSRDDVKEPMLAIINLIARINDELIDTRNTIGDVDESCT